MQHEGSALEHNIIYSHVSLVFAAAILPHAKQLSHTMHGHVHFTTQTTCNDQQSEPEFLQGCL